MNRYYMIIHGKVQGVGFRVFTKKQAIRYNITGWVRNLAVGTVEIEAEGTKKDMERFIRAVRKGSLKSQVDYVEWVQREKKKGYSRFQVLK